MPFVDLGKWLEKDTIDLELKGGENISSTIE